MEQHEEWRPVEGYEGFYEVSSLGRVRSLDRVIQRINRGKRPNVRTARYTGRVLKPKIGTGGYLFVCLYRDSEGANRLIHRLVCAAFHGPSPPGHESGHRNGVKTDCTEENLRWVTKAENEEDKRRHAAERKVAT